MSLFCYTNCIQNCDFAHEAAAPRTINQCEILPVQIH